DFFTVEPQQFQLAGGASRTVLVKSRSQSAGSYWGNVYVHGDGAEIPLDIALLVASRPAGTAIAQPLTTRVEIFGERGLESVGSAINDLKLYFTSGSATSIASLLPLGLSQATNLVNVVNVFGATNASGTLQIRSSKLPSIAADAKVTAILPGGGTMSGSIPVFRGDRATSVDQKIYLTGLTRPGDLVVQETSNALSRVSVQFLDANGNAVGTTNEYDIPARGLLELRDAVPSGATTAILTNLRSGSTILGYARANDASGDTWSIVDWSAANRFNRTDAVRVPFAD